jgi:hypothetical protein
VFEAPDQALTRTMVQAWPTLRVILSVRLHRRTRFLKNVLRTVRLVGRCVRWPLSVSTSLQPGVSLIARTGLFKRREFLLNPSAFAERHPCPP